MPSLKHIALKLLQLFDGISNFAEGASVTSPEDLLELKSILETSYDDGITAIKSVVLDGDGNFVGTFEDAVSPALTKRYSFKITDEDISYKLLNPSDAAEFGEAIFFEDQLVEFAAAKKPKNCKKGTSCGGSCININKKCSFLPDGTTKKKIKDLKTKVSGGSKSANSGGKSASSDDKKFQSNLKKFDKEFRELRRQQELKGVVAIKKSQMQARMQSAGMSKKDFDVFYNRLKSENKIFTVKEKGEELLHWDSSNMGSTKAGSKNKSASSSGKESSSDSNSVDLKGRTTYYLTDVKSISGGASHSDKRTEKLAQQIVKDGGQLAKPIIVIQKGPEKFEVAKNADNERLLSAARKAREIDPRAASMVATHIVKNESEAKAILSQRKHDKADPPSVGKDGQYYLVDTKAISGGGKTKLSTKEVDELAQSQIRVGNANTLVLRQTGADKYEVVAGDAAIAGARRARVIDPKRAEMVGAFVLGKDASTSTASTKTTSSSKGDVGVKTAVATSKAAKSKPLSDTADNLVKQANLVTKDGVDSKGIFGGEIDRLKGANLHLKEVEKTGKWTAGTEAQVGIIKGLLQHGDSPRDIGLYQKNSSRNNTDSEIKLRNGLTRASMESAKLLYSKSSEEAKNQIAKDFYAFRSLDEITRQTAVRNNNPESKAIYADVVKRIKKMYKNGEIKDEHGDFYKEPKKGKKSASAAKSTTTKSTTVVTDDSDPFA